MSENKDYGYVSKEILENADFNEDVGLARVEKNDKYGFIDRTGKIVIPLEYDNVGDFNEGLVKVEKDYKYGFIDTTGKIVIPLEYDDANDFEEGLAKVKKDGKYGCIDTNGKIVLPLEYDAIHIHKFFNGLAKVRIGDWDNENGWDNTKYGFIDTTGQVVIPFEYGDASDFNEGLAVVRIGNLENGKYGFIDTAGKIIVPLEYDNADSFYEGLAKVKKDDKYGSIDRTGKIVIPLEYDYVSNFSNGLAKVKKDDKYGFIDTIGKLVVPIEYDHIGDFSNGLAKVKKDDKWGFIDITGKVVVPVEYDYIDDDLIMTIRQNGKWGGFIDLKTKKKIDTIEQLVEAIKTNCDKKSYIGYSDFEIIINFKELPLVKKFLNLDKNSISLSEIRIDNIYNITTYYAEIDIKEPVIKSKKITAEEVLELSLKGMLDFEIMKQDTYGTEISGGYLNINFNFSGINFFISAKIDDDFQHNNSDDYVSLEYVSDCEVRAKVYYKGGDAGGWDWAECFSNSLNEFFETVPDNEDFNMTELLEEWEDNYEEGDFYSEAESGGNTDYSFRYLDVYFTDYTFKEDMLNLEKEFLKRYYPKQLSEDEMDKIIQKFNINNEELLAELESKLWDST